jgi:hypothetical protein
MGPLGRVQSIVSLWVRHHPTTLFKKMAASFGSRIRSSMPSAT